MSVCAVDDRARIIAALGFQQAWFCRKRACKEIKLMFIDVKKAHLNAKCDEEEWAELPEEFWEWDRGSGAGMRG